MQANRMRHRVRGNEVIQRAILALVLAGFPVLRTMPELVREIGDGEAVERAVGSFIDYGLLEHRGGSLPPTRAALRYHRLDAW